VLFGATCPLESPKGKQHSRGRKILWGPSFDVTMERLGPKAMYVSMDEKKSHDGWIDIHGKYGGIERDA
jgi:hypothetical protein